MSYNESQFTVYCFAFNWNACERCMEKEGYTSRYGMRVYLPFLFDQSECMRRRIKKEREDEKKQY